MGALNYDYTSKMIQPDSELFENYRDSKKDLKRILEQKKPESERLTILLEANERLNGELQRLKKDLIDANKPANLIAKTKQIETDKNSLVSPLSQQQSLQIKQLEAQYNNEIKKNKLLGIKLAKQERLLEEVYESEKENVLENDDINNIKVINQQLSNLLQKLKA